MRLKTLLPLLLLAACPAFASPGFSVFIQFTEAGTGNLSNSGGFNSPLPSSLQNDSGAGGFNNALFFPMLNPPGLIAGDLLLMDGASVSDVIRFDSTLLGGGAFFYSKIGGGLPADLGLPASYLTTTLELSQGANLTLYTPTAGQPGFVTGAAGPVTYQFSEGAPEPATWLLLGPAVAALIAKRRMRGRA